MSYKIVQLKDKDGNNIFPISSDNDYQRGTILAVACRSGDVGGTYSSTTLYAGHWMQYGPMAEYTSTNDVQGQQRSNTIHISVPAGESWTINLSLLVPRIYAPASSWIVFGIAERAAEASSTIKRWLTSAINIQGGNARYPEYCEKTVTLEAGDYYFCPWLISKGSACYAYGAQNFQGGSSGSAKNDWTTPSAAGSGAWQFGWGAIFTATLVDKEYSTLYAPVEYIQTNANAWLDTGLTLSNYWSPSSSTVKALSLEVTTQVATWNGTGDNAIFGVQGPSVYSTAANQGKCNLYAKSGSGMGLGFGKWYNQCTNFAPLTTQPVTYHYTIETARNTAAVGAWGGDLLFSVSSSSEPASGALSNSQTLYIGARNANGTADLKSNIKLYRFKVYSTNTSNLETVIMNLQPVKTLSTIPASMSSTGSTIAANVYAMYDRVTQKIYPSISGTNFTGSEIGGAWTAEAFVERCEYIQCNGENGSGAMANLLFHPYDLGFYYNGSYLAEVHCDAEIVTTGMGTGWQLMMGTAGPSSESYSKRFDFAFRKNNGFDVNMGNAGMTSQGTVTTDRCDYSMVYNGSTNKLCAFHTGTFSQEIDIPSGCTTTSAGNFCLGGRGDRDTYYTRLKIYGFKAGRQSAKNTSYVRVRDMYPAKTIRQVPAYYSSTGGIISAGTYCLYDEVTKKIYPSVGNQQFTGA